MSGNFSALSEGADIHVGKSWIALGKKTSYVILNIKRRDQLLYGQKSSKHDEICNADVAQFHRQF